MALISPHRTGKADEDTSKILKSQSSIYIAGGNDRWSGQSIDCSGWRQKLQECL